MFRDKQLIEKKGEAAENRKIKKTVKLQISISDWTLGKGVNPTFGR